MSCQKEWQRFGFNYKFRSINSHCYMDENNTVMSQFKAGWDFKQNSEPLPFRLLQGKRVASVK